MSRGRLRAGVFALGVVLTLAGAVAGAACSSGTALRLALPGLVLMGGVLCERWRYKPLAEDRPGREWLATEERFIDPESGKPVTVYYDPASGERRYVASP
jgi:hypothetical protein